MYRLYLKQNGEQLLLPVTPAEIETRTGNRNKTAYILDFGEMNLAKKPGLTEIRFTALLPGRAYSFVQTEGGFREPEYFLNRFKEYKASAKPVQMILFRRWQAEILRQYGGAAGGIHGDGKGRRTGGLLGGIFLEGMESGKKYSLQYSGEQHDGTGTGKAGKAACRRLYGAEGRQPLEHCEKAAWRWDEIQGDCTEERNCEPESHLSGAGAEAVKKKGENGDEHKTIIAAWDEHL